MAAGSMEALATAEQAVPGTAGEAEEPSIVLVIPRGEAVRNFLYSETLSRLAQGARITLLSVVDDPEFQERFAPLTEEIITLKEHPRPRAVSYFRTLAENAHDRWVWSHTHQNQWWLRDQRARRNGHVWRRRFVKGATRLLAHRPLLRGLTRVEQSLTYRSRSTREFDALFQRLQPDLVFNGSHIHGLAGELPLRVAHRMGIPTAGFIFSWDNLTSRSRIFVPYDHFFVWHEGMQRELRRIYPEIGPGRIHVTGTPQFDYHFQDDYLLSRQELARRVGFDPERPYVFYTAGIAHHFFEEHRHVELVIRLLDELDLPEKPQLVVRTNVKDTSPEMTAIAERGLPDVYFPRAAWEPRWETPRPEDLPVYTSLLHHCALGINAASTVTLELLMLDKPCINLDFDPPGAELAPELGYSRHLLFDHYRPVAESGAVMVARSEEDMAQMLRRGLTDPDELALRRQAFIRHTFGHTLDGHAGRRVAEGLLSIATEHRMG